MLLPLSIRRSPPSLSLLSPPPPLPVTLSARLPRIAMLAESPVLPLPVELVAGGDGRPESREDMLEMGLGGSGRSGR